MSTTLPLAVSFERAAELLELCPDRFREQVLPHVDAVRIGDSIRVSVAALHRYLEGSRVRLAPVQQAAPALSAHSTPKTRPTPATSVAPTPQPVDPQQWESVLRSWVGDGRLFLIDDALRFVGRTPNNANRERMRRLLTGQLGCETDGVKKQLRGRRGRWYRQVR